ncbi:protein immune deficiency [Hetaerina americana]|uniref:protein immune deficiency n=1 Tax=Hetaerina americana TaxID=62018 RepID=UPI003A7F1C7D
MSSDDGSELTADAEPISPSDFEKISISSEDKKSDSSSKVKERRKSSTSKPKVKTIRPGSTSNVQMNFVNTHEVHVGNNITYYSSPCAPAPDFVRSTSALKKTAEIKELLSCKDVVTKEEILWLSSHVGKRWRDVGTLLGYDCGQLDQFEEDYGRSGIKQSIYQMLLDWKNSRLDEEATVTVLAKALWKGKEREAVQGWVNRKGKPEPPLSA